MRHDRYDIVIFGLSVTSSWGNGHATTYRALLRGLAEEGRRVLFVERDVPWYRDHRDLPAPPFCDLALYRDLEELLPLLDAVRTAGLVIVGSYVPQGAMLIDLLLELRPACLAFYDIDTPVTLSLLAAGETVHLRPDQIPRLDLYLSFSGGPTLRTLEKRWGARRAAALHCAVDSDAYTPPEIGEPRWDLGYLGTWSADRQPGLERLLLGPARQLPHCRFVVAGPQYPADIEWPDNVERIEHLPPSQHRAFYGDQRFTLNLTRQDMVRAGWSPSVRLFEAAACGTPIVSDRWAGLGDLFPEGRAILIADGADDVVRALEAMPESERLALGREARAIVLEGHTGRKRARQLLREARLAEPVS